MRFFQKYKIAIWILIVAAGMLLIFPRIKEIRIDDLVSFTPDSQILAALVFLTIYCLKTVFPVIPAVLLYMAAGIIFPTGWAFLLTYICLFSEAALGYFIGRKLGEEKVVELFSRRPRIAAFFKRYLNRLQPMCFFTRLLPIPFDLSSMFFGVMRVPFRRFLPLTLLGATPALVPYVLAGSAILEPLSMRFLLPFGISIVISVTVFIIFQRLTKRRDAENG